MARRTFPTTKAHDQGDSRVASGGHSESDLGSGGSASVVPPPPPPPSAHPAPVPPAPADGPSTAPSNPSAWASSGLPGWAPPSGGAPVRPRPPRQRREPDASPGNLLALVLVAGFLLEVGLRGGLANAFVAAGIGVLVVALLTGGRLRRASSRRLALAALVPAAFLVVRASPWLAASNVAMAMLLLAAAVVFDRGGEVTDTGPADLAWRVGAALPMARTAPDLLAPLVPRSSGTLGGRARGIARGALIASPLLLVVVLLLASGDAVFAGLLSPDVHIGPTLGHLLFGLCCAAAVAGVVAAAGADTDRERGQGSLGPVEVATMLALAVLVLALFVVSQLVALTDAGERLVEESGLTPADYARSGFFQLCWATGLILAFLALVERLAAPGARARRVVHVLGALVPVLALGLVGGALRRMALYDQAFGMTMLRLWVVATMVWFGIVLVLVALRNLGVGDGRRWVTAAATVAALALVLVADVANPEAFVVHHNVDRAKGGVDLDGAYLVALSDDAVPAIVNEAGRAGDDEVGQILRSVAGCTDERTGAAAVNVGAAQAESAAEGECAVPEDSTSR